MFVFKKNGKLRLVINYKQLNEITVKNRTLLLFITEIKNRLYGTKWFITLDLKERYYYIQIKPENKQKTAFRTKYGLYKYLVMLFELTNVFTSF